MPQEILGSVEKGPHGDERPSYSAASGETELRFVLSLNMTNLVCLHGLVRPLQICRYVYAYM